MESADADPVEFKWFDWPGITNPAAEDGDDHDGHDHDGESGAVALISASVAALAAFLVF